MKNCSMIKKILKILSEKKIYYIFLFLKVSQCKFEQKQTILKLTNPLKSK
jgi:arsenate reductase-like glutaredoxin family protein